MRQIGLMIATLGLIADAKGRALSSPAPLPLLRMSTAPYACPPPITPVTDLSGLQPFYKPGRTQSEVDREKMAQYVAVVGRIDRLSQKLIDLTKAMALKPSARKAISVCVVAEVIRWSSAEALTRGAGENDPVSQRQAVLVTAWASIGIANAYLLARETSDISHDDSLKVQRWFTRLADIVEAGLQQRPGLPRQLKWLNADGNHRLWGAASTAMIAVVLDEHDRFARSMRIYRNALVAADVDGALAPELTRGSKSLQYQSFSLSALALLTRLADMNNVRLAEEEERALARIVEFTIEAFNNPELLRTRTGFTQERNLSMNWWMQLILIHFRWSNPALARRISGSVPANPMDLVTVGLAGAQFLSRPEAK